MYKRILISLLVAFMFFIPLIPVETSGDVDEDMLDLTPHWREFSRDTNHNGIDDLIDGRSDNDINIFVVYDHHPTDGDVEVLESLGLEIYYRAKYVDSIIVNSVSRDQINLVRFLKGVTMVELSPYFKPMLDISTKNIKARPTNLGDDGVKYPDVWEQLGYDGTGINIAILDTGVNNKDHESLDDLDDDFFTYDPKFIAGWWGVGGTAVDPDDYGFTSHGTHCAGTAMGTGGTAGDYAGVAPGARLVDVKVMSDVGAGGIPIPAIEWCIDNKDTDWENDGPANDGIQVMSMSIGGANSNGDDQTSLAVNEAVNNGIVVVAAMGNGQGNSVNTPAAADRAIAVAGSDDHGTVTRDDDTFGGYSNYGPRMDGGLKPDITAPGAAIMSSLKDTGFMYGEMTGTSMSTPHVAGVVALMLQANPDLTPEDVKRILRLTGEERGNNHISPDEPKYDTHWGWGLMDAYAAVNLALGMPDLTVSSIEVQPSGSSEGDDIRILADIRELNDRDAEADIEFHDETNGKIIATVHSTFGGWTTTTVPSGDFRALGGDRTFRVVIVNSEPEEDDVTNNQMLHSIHINYRPEPEITANDTEVKTGEKISFDGSGSSDRDGSVKEFRFEWGDGTDTGWVTESQFEHSYDDDGEYNVSLRVKDDMDAESTDAAGISITVRNRAPTAGAGSDRTATENEEVEFSGEGQDEDGTIELFEWDFDGDGKYDWASEDDGDTTHTYTQEGNYTAMLRVTDDDGAIATDDRLIEVLPEGTPNTPPNAKITKPLDDGEYPLEEDIEFDGSESTDPDEDILSFSWTDNGREFSTEETFFARLDAGSHHIVLQVDDGRGGVDATEIDIYVNSPPTAVMASPEEGKTYFTNEAIDFDGSQSSDPDDDELSFRWFLDGGSVSSEERWSSKLQEGEYRIVFEVMDGVNDGVWTDEIYFTVEKPENRPPDAVISQPLDEQEFRDNETITFDARESSDPDEDSIIYEWYIDDQLESNDAFFTLDQTPGDHLAHGDHEVHLIVWDDKDENDHDYVTITITDNKRPVARITEPEDGGVFSEGIAIDFDGTHSTDEEGDDLEFRWYDGEDFLSDEGRFTRELDVGEHEISLTVNDSRKEGTTMVTIRVNQRPSAVISSPSEGDVYFSDEVVTFDATSSSDPDGKIVGYFWDDNDESLGSGSTMEQVLDTGNHDITLTVKDDDATTDATTVSVKSVDHSISFRLTENVKEADKDGRGVFQIKLKNLAEKSDFIRLSADEAVDFSEDSFIMGPNAERTITMTVTSNRDLDIQLTAWAGQFPSYAIAKLKMAPTFDVVLFTTQNTLSNTPGTSVTYILVVTNEGNGDDSITMGYDSEKTWEVTLTPETLDLHPGASDRVLAKVKIPATVAPGDNMVLDVTATSKDGETMGRITLTTMVVQGVNPNPNPPEDKSDDGLPGFDAVLALVSIAVAVSVAFYRKRR